MGYLELLVKSGIMNRYQVEEVLEQAKTNNGNLDKALEAMKIPDDAILAAKSEYFGVPSKHLENGLVSIDALKYIPEDAAKNYRIVPLGFHNGTLDVGVLDPSDLQVRNALQFITSKTNIPFDVFIISYTDYKTAVEAYGGYSDTSGTDGGDVVGFAQDDVLDVTSDTDTNTDTTVNQTTGVIVEDAPATKMISVMVRNAVDGGASDIHIEHTGTEVKIRFRVDGKLYTSLRVARSMHSALIAKIKSLSNLKLDEKRKPQDGRFMANVSGRKIDFRGSIFPTFFGEKAVIRILDSGKGLKKLDELGMTPEHVTAVRDALSKPYGMVLITGPTGAGKTTTLYSMLNELDREILNVVSLEDPVEYNIPGMNQSQVRPEIGYTFATGLRSILRQDPDVIMVGEIRDKETAELAINAALTGHLVFATLHTNNAVGAIPRLIDMGIDPYLIAPTLIMSLGQRMVAQLKPNGGKKITIDETWVPIIKHEFADLDAQYLTKLPLTKELSDISDDKSNPGTHGRIGCFELFTMDKELQKIILKDPTEPVINDYLKKSQGMISMRQDAVLKSMAGLIPWSEVNTL